MLLHSGPIAGIAAHDSWVATAGYDNKVILWDARTHKAVAQGVHDHLVNNCAFSPDGQWLVSASSDYSARLWSLPAMRLQAVLPGHGDDVDMAVFSPDSQWIATCALDRLVRVFDLQGRCQTQFAGHTGNVLALAWTPDGQHVISTSVDGTIRQWHVQSGQQVSIHDLQIRTDSLEIASNGTIYAGDDLGRIAILRNGQTEYVQAHQAGIKKVVLNDATHQLVCLSYDSSMSIWNVQPNTPERIAHCALPELIWARSAAVTNSGHVVVGTFGATYAVFDMTTRQWDMSGVQAGSAINAVLHDRGDTYSVGDSGEVLKNQQALAHMGSLCNFLTRSSDWLLTGGQLGQLFNAKTGEVLHQHHSPLNCGVHFERDGQAHVAVGTYTGEILVFKCTEQSVTQIECLKVYDNAVKGVSVTGTQLFSVCANTSIAWHSLLDFSLVRQISHAHDKIANDCCAIDAQHVATISRDRTLKIWNDQGVQTYLSPHPNSIKCMAIDDEKSHILTGSYGGTLALFDLRSKAWAQFERPTSAGISDITWHNVQQQFLAASYDGNIYPLKA